MKLCFLASLLLCDKKINAEVAKVQSGRGFLFVIEMWWIAAVFVAKM
jgi:hypothetical protein